MDSGSEAEDSCYEEENGELLSADAKNALVQKVKDWVKDDDNDLSICTLAYMHASAHDATMQQREGTRLVKPCSKATTVLVLVGIRVLQLVLPFLLLYGHMTNAKHGYLKKVGLEPETPFQSLSRSMQSDMMCPKSASLSSQITMFFIGFMYAAKLRFRSMTKKARDEKLAVKTITNAYIDDGRGLANEDEYMVYDLLRESPINDVSVFLSMDEWFEVWWEGFIYVLNMLIIYFTDDVTDMVANCLYMEFLTQIDDEVKKVYLNLYEPSGTVFYETIRRPTSLPGLARVFTFLVQAMVCTNDAFCWIVFLATPVAVHCKV